MRLLHRSKHLKKTLSYFRRIATLRSRELRAAAEASADALPALPRPARLDPDAPAWVPERCAARPRCSPAGAAAILIESAH